MRNGKYQQTTEHADMLKLTIVAVALILGGSAFAASPGRDGLKAGWQIDMEQNELRYEVVHHKNMYSGGPTGRQPIREAY